MKQIDEHLCSAPVATCFEVGADVESWPRILPHYRWVRFHEKRGFADGVVEMAAWRAFGFLKYPTWWVSEMSHDRKVPIVRYRHVKGITSKMDVRWEFEPVGKQTLVRVVHEWSGPSWPIIGTFAANIVIGPMFISAIARRTLAGVAREAERRASS